MQRNLGNVFASPVEFAGDYNVQSMREIFYGRHVAPIGPLIVGVSEEGLAVLEFEKGHLRPQRRRGDVWTRSARRVAPVIAELNDYFAAKRRHFSIPLDLRGTDFQLRCWQALLDIPYGQTITYAELARRVGCPRGFRAVGMANHDNPVAIVVPCHRVLASDGSLGGYGGGLDLKRALLELEGALPRTLNLLPA
ncbi:MAG TPA: methylated-DNA--[protein]-cysteine S-methyltransferase [Terriglobales bacterium]|nr:methylated-DNA--[protein]-cysteine S-methyltransferase [Terriglobales bacterium]